MRRTFSQALKNGKFNLQQEYMKLYEIVYETSEKYSNETSLWEIFKENFLDYPFRGNCLCLTEFDKKYGYTFEKEPENLNLDNFIMLCEYTYNMLYFIDVSFEFIKVDNEHKISIFKYIESIIKEIGYISVENNDYIILVPQDSAAISVAESELIPDDVSYKIIAYNHSSKKGNLDAKKIILIKLAELLEPKKKNLDSINKSFSSDLFMLINSCNIRHNNIDSALTGKYHKYIAEMSNKELEHTYDEIYQMCLLAFMQLEQIGRNEWVKDLKDKITSVK